MSPARYSPKWAHARRWRHQNQLRVQVFQGFRGSGFRAQCPGFTRLGFGLRVEVLGKMLGAQDAARSLRSLTPNPPGEGA